MNTRVAQSVEDLARWLEGAKAPMQKPTVVINVFDEGMRGYVTIHVPFFVLKEMLKKLGGQDGR